MTNEVWAPIPGYPDYAISSEGRVWNVKLNKEVSGHRADGRTRVTLKNQNGDWHSYRKDQIINSVDFMEMSDRLPIRKVRDVDSGEIWENADEAIRHLRVDRSDAYKVLRGQRPHVGGVTLEYFYVEGALG